MPIYEFNCRKCGNEKEQLVSIRTTTLVCDNCGDLMQKIISKSSFILKGGGWAADNYGAKPVKKVNKDT